MQIQSSVRSSELPSDSLLQDCGKKGAFTDCYVTDVEGSVSQSAFVEAFYTTPLFKVERLLLKWFAARPSTDAEAKQLADGNASSFAAWRVEAQSANQLLLADMTGRTKSWLMASPVPGSVMPVQTRLHFGSAVVPASSSSNGVPRMGLIFQALLGFHRLYSRLLLGAARTRVLLNKS
jgi:hypothetical protein